MKTASYLQDFEVQTWEAEFVDSQRVWAEYALNAPGGDGPEPEAHLGGLGGPGSSRSSLMEGDEEYM